MKNFRKEIDEAARKNFPFESTRDKWFIHEDIPESDRELFFGPLDGTEEFTTFNDKMNLFNILAIAGVFPSATQARKNAKNILPKLGLDSPDIPAGFFDFVAGKKRFQITVLNKGNING